MAADICRASPTLIRHAVPYVPCCVNLLLVSYWCDSLFLTVRIDKIDASRRRKINKRGRHQTFVDADTQQSIGVSLLGHSGMTSSKSCPGPSARLEIEGTAAVPEAKNQSIRF